MSRFTSTTKKESPSRGTESLFMYIQTVVKKKYGVVKMSWDTNNCLESLEIPEASKDELYDLLITMRSMYPKSFNKSDMGDLRGNIE